MNVLDEVGCVGGADVIDGVYIDSVRPIEDNAGSGDAAMVDVAACLVVASAEVASRR